MGFINVTLRTITLWLYFLISETDERNAPVVLILMLYYRSYETNGYTTLIN